MNKAEYSKQSMAKALLRLMETEDYDRITIQQIVDTAGVSRMAFYRNFETKDQILQYHVNRITDEFVRNAHMKEKYDNATGTTTGVYDNSRSMTGKVGNTVSANSRTDAPNLTSNINGYE